MPCGRGLLAGQASGVQVCGQFADRGRPAAAEHDEGDRYLTEPCVGTRDNSGLAHCRVRREEVLDVSRGEFLTATIDDVFDSAGDREASVVVEDPDVAGPEPAVVVESG